MIDVNKLQEEGKAAIEAAKQLLGMIASKSAR